MNRSGFVIVTFAWLAAIVLSPLFLVAQEKETATLADLRLEFHAARAKLPDPRESLMETYAGHLEQLQNKVTEAGNLEKALAVKNERVKFRTGGSVPVGADFPELQRLQQVYAAQTQKADAAIAADLARLVAVHTSRIERLQVELTKLGKLDEAVSAKEEIAGMAKLVPALPSATDGIFENSLGMKFAPVPIVGGPTDGKRLLFSIWETRVKDWAAFAKEENIEIVDPEFEQGDDHPAVNFYLPEAKSFCEWLTKVDRRAKLIGPDDRYRVPSDHEWSCAAGIGAREDAMATPSSKMSGIPTYAWGADWPPPVGAGNFQGEETNGKSELFKDVGIEGYSDNFVFTAPVGSFAPNQFGLFDIFGNVAEWTASAWKTPGESGTSMRGCSWWHYQPDFFHMSRRFFIYHKSRRNFVGFRCVLEKE